MVCIALWLIMFLCGACEPGDGGDTTTTTTALARPTTTTTVTAAGVAV